jgi:hypothetical protein
MKYIHLTLILVLVLTSCQFFETEKISSDEFYEEGIKAIEWDDVDHYPTFKACEQYTEKTNQKKCFETTLGTFVQEFIANKKITSNQDLNHTAVMDFNISKTGEISNLNITVDSVLLQKVPQLKEWLAQSMDSLPKLEPAQKRAVPVATQFTLPVVIKTEKVTN